METADIIEEVKKYIEIPSKYQEKSGLRNEEKYAQIIRNPRSNKNNKNNFINVGYAEDIKGGFRIIQKGIDFIENEFTELFK